MKYRDNVLYRFNNNSLDDNTITQNVYIVIYTSDHSMRVLSFVTMMANVGSRRLETSQQ